METSRYFERTLFYDRSPVADEYYERSSDSIFENDPQLSRIEVRIQSSNDLVLFDREGGADIKSEKIQEELEVHEQKSSWDATITDEKFDSKRGEQDVDACTVSSVASSTALPTALDQRRGGSAPPTYPGPPKLAIIDLDLSKLHEFVKATTHDFRVL
ncbi:hypothetical protein BCR34DRAFT_564134 [Clohesyomyces aquaticus]|uniref:Uncharacterized protein n=1 Tax=Clohesyomyces aquaticus TaxID=1231657 RepID=A0A1Y1ZR46_9PLEO|nr:hypothetical protein BCR34DRAFT_564134 [Clohesyomyces aquaticus]